MAIATAIMSRRLGRPSVLGTDVRSWADLDFSSKGQDTPVSLGAASSTAPPIAQAVAKAISRGSCSDRHPIPARPDGWQIYAIATAKVTQHNQSGIVAAR